MFPFIMISLREGLEAFLAIAVASLYLRSSGRAHLLGALKWGVCCALAGSAFVGVLMARLGADSHLVEGWLALLAFGSVLACLAHAAARGPSMASSIASGLGSAASARAGDGAPASGRPAMSHAGWWAVFGFSVLMVGREGLEAAAMAAAFSATAHAWPMAAGTAIGLAAAGLAAWLWGAKARGLDIKAVFAASAFFMAALSVQLLAVAAHAFAEAGAAPWVDNAWLHGATESFAEGELGTLYGFAIMALPASWLAWRSLRKARSAPTPA